MTAASFTRDIVPPSFHVQGVASELVEHFDLKWQHLTRSQTQGEVVEGAWTTIKRQVVATVGPSGFSLLARALEMSRQSPTALTEQGVSELLVALELCATPAQRQLLEQVLYT